MLTFSFVALVGVLGALIGSFANVVIYRLPRGESVVFPGSHCPNCGHNLGALELVPVLSWLGLRGRCRGCRAPISARYPVIELLMAAGFVGLALRWPLDIYGVSVLPLLAVYAVLVIASLIDIDHYILPDALTLPAVVLGLVGTFLYAPSSGLPTLSEALLGGALGAGVIVVINRLGGLVLRRFADTKERLWPVGMDAVNVAALFGALGGWGWGLAAAALSFLLNLTTKRTLRLPEPLVYALWIAALLLASLNLWIDPLTALRGSFAAAGGVAVLGAAFWWLRDFGKAEAERPDMSSQADAPLNEAEDEPIAMGFGDVKLAAVLGVLLGPQDLFIALFLAFVLGAVGGLLLKAISGNRQVPFGPYLALGGVVALLYGQTLLNLYLGFLGV